MRAQHVLLFGALLTSLLLFVLLARMGDEDAAAILEAVAESFPPDPVRLGRR
jgi:hypothetical protein